MVARALEKKGIISDRCEINRQIKADNALLRELKATVRKLADAVKNTIPAIAEAMENLRRNMIIFRYQLLHIRSGKAQLGKRLDAVRPGLERYAGLVKQIKGKVKERQALLVEKKVTPMLQMLRHRELDVALAQHAELNAQAAELDEAELVAARQVIRPEKDRDAMRRVQSAYGQMYDGWRMQQSKEDVAAMLGEAGEPTSIIQQLKKLVDQQQTQ